MKIKPGDVVTLRSGGQKMTVARALEPPQPNPLGIGDLFPPEPFRPGWICRWMVQGAARAEAFEEVVLAQVPD